MRDYPGAAGATLSFGNYAARLQSVLRRAKWDAAASLAAELLDCWKTGRQVFLCGNGGSAANALHIANDLIYGIGDGQRPGLRIHALPANSPVVTCLANDEGYAEIFSLQLRACARRGDVLIALSGSGNSANVLRAIEEARSLGVKSFAILGFDGGRAKSLVDVPIHFPVDDMQISEDLQLIVAHMTMQWLKDRATSASSAVPMSA